MHMADSIPSLYCMVSSLKSQESQASIVFLFRHQCLTKHSKESWANGISGSGDGNFLFLPEATAHIKLHQVYHIPRFGISCRQALTFKVLSDCHTRLLSVVVIEILMGLELGALSAHSHCLKTRQALIPHPKNMLRLLQWLPHLCASTCHCYQPPLPRSHVSIHFESLSRPAKRTFGSQWLARAAAPVHLYAHGWIQPYFSHNCWCSRSF